MGAGADEAVQAVVRGLGSCVEAEGRKGRRGHWGQWRFQGRGRERGAAGGLPRDGRKVLRIRQGEDWEQHAKQGNFRKRFLHDRRLRLRFVLQSERRKNQQRRRKRDAFVRVVENSVRMERLECSSRGEICRISEKQNKERKAPSSYGGESDSFVHGEFEKFRTRRRRFRF